MANEGRVPAEVVPPGEHIREELEERGWNQLDLAEILGRPLTLVNEILTGRRAITPETAQGLGDAFGVDPQFFLNLESAYQLWKVGRAKGRDESVAKRASLYEMPVRELVKRRWIEGSSSVEILERRIAAFYGVRDFQERPNLWPVAARMPAGVDVTWSHWAWFVRAKQLGRAAPVSAKFTPARLDEAIGRLRGLLHAPQEARHAPRILADAGVRLVMIEHLPKTRLDGGCLWIDEHSPVVAISLRYDRVDYFWHTLMHELKHVEKRHAYRDHVPFDEDIFGKTAEPSARSEIERAIDGLASDALIPRAELEDFILRTKPLYARKKIIGFARRIEVHPGIVVGQLQHRREIDWSHSRDLLARIRQFVSGAGITDGWGNFVSVPA